MLSYAVINYPKNTRNIANTNIKQEIKSNMNFTIINKIYIRFGLQKDMTNLFGGKKQEKHAH